MNNTINLLRHYIEILMIPIVPQVQIKPADREIRSQIFYH